MVASVNENGISWWDAPFPFVEHVVDASFDLALAVAATDVDGDGDPDLLGAEWNDPAIAWWENPGTVAGPWIRHTLNGAFESGTSVAAIDLDNDGDIDVLGASALSNSPTWWENRGGQIIFDTSSVAPLEVSDGQIAAVLAIDAAHAGRSGDDPVELGELLLRLEEAPGDALSAAEANGLFESIFLYADDPGGIGVGHYDPADPLVATFADFTSVGPAGRYSSDGTLIWLIEDQPEITLPAGATQRFFVVLEMRPDASGQAGIFQLTHLVADRDHDRPYSVQHGADVSSGLVQIQDSVAPVANLITTSVVRPTHRPVSFTVGFSEAVQGFNTVEDLQLAHDGTSHGGGVSFSSEILNDVFTVTLADLSGTGSFTLAASTVSDVVNSTSIALGGSVVSAPVFFDETLGEVPFGDEEIIASGFLGAYALDLADFDRDGDLDVVGVADQAGEVLWWENLEDSGWSSQPEIDGNFGGARSVEAGDLDGDGSPDVVAAGISGHIEWWHNFEDALSWDGHSPIAELSTIYDLALADIDRDGDLDIVVAATRDHDMGHEALTWWENDLDTTFDWNEHTIDPVLINATSVVVADIDGDGDPDVLATSPEESSLSWWENGAAWLRRDLTVDLDQALTLVVVDLDGDGDLDVAASGGGASDSLSWWESDLESHTNPGDELQWTEHLIHDAVDTVVSLAVEDLDLDGDPDLIGAAFLGNALKWWENTTGSATAWIERPLETLGGARTVVMADVDGDGDSDVLGASNTNAKLIWLRNRLPHSSTLLAPDDEHVLNSTFFNEARRVASADMDGDGDLDVLGAASGKTWAIAWWEQPEDPHQVWPEHPVDEDFNSARWVSAADLNGDGIQDLLGVALGANQIAWWEGDGGGSFPTSRQSIADGFTEALMAIPGDLDGDGDLDVVGAAGVSANANEVLWWENHEGAWNEKPNPIFSKADAVALADLDGSGTLDILAAQLSSTSIVLWKNANGKGTSWSEKTISSTVGARSLVVADFDGLGNLDIASVDHQGISWWREEGASWIQRVVSADFAAHDLAAADVDGDGDVDLLGTRISGEPQIAWWENPGLVAENWPRRTFASAAFDSGTSITAVDLDGDGDIDVLGAAKDSNSLTWWENRGGQMIFDTSAIAPDDIFAGEATAVLAIDAAHAGLAGDDPVRLAELLVRFEKEPGVVLSAAEANALFENVALYADDGADAGNHDASDTQVALFTDFTSVGPAGRYVEEDGRLIWWIAEQSAATLSAGASETFFVVVKPHLDAVGTFELIHLVADRDHDLPYSVEHGMDVSSDSVGILDPVIFMDGFESGDCSAWSVCF